MSMFIKRLANKDNWQCPTNWSVVLLEKNAKRGSGHTPNKKIPEYWNQGIKWVSLSDSYRLDNVYIHDTDKKISELGIANSSAVLHPPGIVILSRDAGVGKSAITSTEMAVSQHFIVWECNDKILNNHFLYYWLQFMKPEFERIAIGSTIKTIGLPYFKRMLILRPPLPEQRKIADILGTWDEEIRLTERLIEAKQTYKKGVMQQLLTGKMRFPGFEGEWGTYRFGEIFERVRRKNTIGNEVVLTISAQHGLVAQEEFFNKRVASRDLSGYYLLRKGEFAYNKSYSNGYPFGAMKRLDSYDVGVLSTLYICFKLKADNQDSDFYTHFFESGGMNRGIYTIAQEGARNHGLLNMSIKDFFNLKVTVPDFKEQKKLGALFNGLDDEISLLQRKAIALREQKKGLMQQLLTGKVRV